MNTVLITVGRSKNQYILVESFIKKLDLPEITKLLALKKVMFSTLCFSFHFSYFDGFLLL
jgi:hypothetical protein